MDMNEMLEVRQELDRGLVSLFNILQKRLTASRTNLAPMPQYQRRLLKVATAIHDEIRQLTRDIEKELTTLRRTEDGDV